MICFYGVRHFIINLTTVRPSPLLISYVNKAEQTDILTNYINHTETIQQVSYNSSSLLGDDMQRYFSLRNYVC